MSRNEDEVAIFHAVARPLKIVIEVRRFVIFVDSKKSDVEIVARVGEIIGIASEEGDVEFRREHQTDIGVLLVLVEVINLARIENHYITAQSGRSGAVFFDLRHGGALGLAGGGRRHPGLHAGIDLIGHILDANELIELQIWAFGLFRLRLGIEAGLDVVVALGRELLDASRAHMVVGEGQTVRRHKRAGSAVVESYRGEANMIEPRRSEFEAVFGLDFVLRSSVIEPHAFVGSGECGKQEDNSQQNRKRTLHFGSFLPEEYDELYRTAAICRRTFYYTPR